MELNDLKSERREKMLVRLFRFPNSFVNTEFVNMEIELEETNPILCK